MRGKSGHGARDVVDVGVDVFRSPTKIRVELDWNVSRQDPIIPGQLDPCPSLF